jgi:hypothetical protein
MDDLDVMYYNSGNVKSVHLFFTNDIVGCSMDDLDVMYCNSGNVKSVHLFFTNDIVGCSMDDLDVLYCNSGNVKSVHLFFFFVHSILYYSEHMMASMNYFFILDGEI